MDDAIRIGAAAQALGVSVDTRAPLGARRTDRLRAPRQPSRVEAEELARILRERGTSSRSSARNRLAGVIVDVQRDGVMAQIDLACGPYRVVSLMSREAADELELKPGQTVTAVVKSTIVVVERT